MTEQKENPNREEPKFQLWRQDDAGNIFPMPNFRFGTAEEAEGMRSEFEGRGHKQTYWVEPIEEPSEENRDIPLQ